jgi:hypothetical protein
VKDSRFTIVGPDKLRKHSKLQRTLGTSHGRAHKPQVKCSSRQQASKLSLLHL